MTLDLFNANVQTFDGVLEPKALAEALTETLQQIRPTALAQETAEDANVLGLRVPPSFQLHKSRMLGLIILVNILAGGRIDLPDGEVQGVDILAVFVLKDGVGGQKGAAVLG